MTKTQRSTPRHKAPHKPSLLPVKSRRQTRERERATYVPLPPQHEAHCRYLLHLRLGPTRSLVPRLKLGRYLVLVLVEHSVLALGVVGVRLTGKLGLFEALLVCN